LKEIILNLVKQRLAWEVKYHLGATHNFQAFIDYKENRMSEHFRLSTSLEEFMEYVISLENKITELSSSR
jgi:hypothetical protein